MSQRKPVPDPEPLTAEQARAGRIATLRSWIPIAMRQMGYSPEEIERYTSEVQMAPEGE